MKVVRRKKQITDAGVDPGWWDEFFTLFAVYKDVAQAARECGATPTAVKNARKESLEFNDRFKDCWAALSMHLEASAMARAIHGWDEPVYFKGELVGTKRVYNAALTIFMLKANIPEKYHLERHEADSSAEEQGRLMREFLVRTDPKLRLVKPNTEAG